MTYVKELHFQNLVKIMQGTFFCVVDCFLEIWLRKVCARPNKSFNGSRFLSLLYDSGVQNQALMVLKGDEPVRFRARVAFFKVRYMGIY